MTIDLKEARRLAWEHAERVAAFKELVYNSTWQPKPIDHGQWRNSEQLVMAETIRDLCDEVERLDQELWEAKQPRPIPAPGKTIITDVLPESPGSEVMRLMDPIERAYLRSSPSNWGQGEGVLKPKKEKP